LRLGYELRVKRLLVTVLAIVLAGAGWPSLVEATPSFFAWDVLWSPGFIAVATFALVGTFVVERGLFGLRMYRMPTAGKG
jgi:hypothetical protein